MKEVKGSRSADQISSGWVNGFIGVVIGLQLLQPLLGLGLAATLLHEQVSIGMFGITVGVVLCVAGTKKFASNV